MRRRPVAATPEEAIRQRFIQLLLAEGYPLSSIQVEYPVSGGRLDVAVALPDGSLWLLAECKAHPHHTAEALLQLRRYAAFLSPVHHLAIVSPVGVWCWKASTGELLSQIPPYPRCAPPNSTFS